MDQKEVMDRFAAKVYKAFDVSRQRCSVPVWFWGPDGNSIPDRSGVLLRVVDQSFLLTAAHDFQSLLDAGYRPCIGLPENQMPVTLEYRVFYLSKSEREDICILLLSEATGRELDRHFAFLRLSDVMSRRSPKLRDCLYMAAGFSGDLEGVDENGERFVGCWRYIDAAYKHPDQVIDYDPNLHVVLHYDSGATPGNPQQIKPPKMSGCGIWFLGTREKIHACFRNGYYNREEFRLIGIDHHWQPDREYIKGTWIDHAVREIWNRLPDHRPTMRRLYDISF